MRKGGNVALRCELFDPGRLGGGLAGSLAPGCSPGNEREPGIEREKEVERGSEPGFPLRGGPAYPGLPGGLIPLVGDRGLKSGLPPFLSFHGDDLLEGEWETTTVGTPQPFPPAEGVPSSS